VISLPPKGDNAKKLGAYFAPLKVEAQASPNMTVKVAAGGFWTATGEYMEYSGGTSQPITNPTADAKWVIIALKPNGQLNPPIDGIASATPDLPDSSLYKDYLPLAAIFVGNTTLSITNDMIYDLRPMWQIQPDSVSQSQLDAFATVDQLNDGLATKAETFGTADEYFTLNTDGGSLPAITGAGIAVSRPGGTVSIRFVEESVGSPDSGPHWEFTNDGATWNPIGVSTGSFYSKAQLDGGALDFRYYTENELSSTGVLDSRYYTETEANALFAPISHNHTVSEITDFPVAGYVETVNTLAPVLGDISLNINDILDVTSSGAGNKHVLVHNGTNYVNRFLVTDDLNDVDTTSLAPANKHVLVHNGVKFVNRALVKSDISDFVDADHVVAKADVGSPNTGVDQDVYGIKTFKNGIIIEQNLQVLGTNTSIETNELYVKDTFVDINYGDTANLAANGTGTAGIRISRGVGGSPASNLPDAIIQWDESAKQWELGVEGSATPIVSSLSVQLDLAQHMAETGSPPSLFHMSAAQNAFLDAIMVGSPPTLATEVGYLNGVTSLIQPQIDSKIGRAGDAMDSAANLTFSGGGEVLGLPAIPSATAAASKEYVDAVQAALHAHAVDTGSPTVFHMTADQNAFLDAIVVGSPATMAAEINFLNGVTSNVQVQIDSKIGRAGDAMDSAANLTFSGGGEVLGLPTVPSATGASSKEYVDAQTSAIQAALHAHAVDTGSPTVFHMTADQNAFLDAIVLGSPAVMATEVNHLNGVTSNIQAQLNLKANFVGGSPNVVGNILRIAANGDMEDAGVAVNDAGTTVADLWTANKIDTTKADKVSGAVAGNFAGLDGSGNLTDSGSNAASFAAAVHTHVAANITDFSTAVTAELNVNNLDEMQDVAYAGIANGDFLKRVAGVWANQAPSVITDFVRTQGSIAESINGVKTFSDSTVFSSTVTVNGDLIVNGTTTTIDATNLNIDDNNITLNRNYTGATSGSTGSGITIVRGGGSPLAANAVLVWDNTLETFKAGVDGTELPLAKVGTSVAQPLYTLVSAPAGSPGAYILSWNIPTPSVGHAAIQIFVNGIKQIEGASKAYQVSGYGTGTITITFNAGSEPTALADVEIYGFGYIE